MLPVAITLANYRSFVQPQRIDLRPITLFYGNNNAGKSALLRALPLIADSVSPLAGGPLELESPATRGSTFADLRWKALDRDDERTLRITFHWDAPGISSAEFAMDWFDDWKRVVVRHFEIRDQHETPRLAASWVPRPEDRTREHIAYELAMDQQTWRTSLGFPGLVPSHALEPHHPARSLLDAVVDRQRALAGQVQWLSATRNVPARISPYPPAPRWRMKSDGRDAISVLALNAEVLTDVSRWYESHLRRGLSVLDVPPGSFRTVLKNLDRAAFDVDLIDTGEGMIQVLPVLTAAALAQRHDEGGPTILAIEEPESHLHPDLQRALAEHLCALVREVPSVRTVMETHSEHLLLSVQLQIARGDLDPASVLVYWVRQLDSGESIADPVTFDENARPQGNWPPDVFSEDSALARELLQARREKKRKP